MSASAAQLDIGFAPVPSDPGPLELAFLEFHRSNPRVFCRLVQLARADAAAQDEAGVRRPRVAVKGLWEQLRKELRGVKIEGQSPVKLNNNHTAFYARLIAETHHDLAGVFRTRERTA